MNEVNQEADLSFLLNPQAQVQAPVTFEQALVAAAAAAENLAGVLRSPTGRPGLPPGHPERVLLEKAHLMACERAAALCPYKPGQTSPEPPMLAPEAPAVPIPIDPADAAEAARRRAEREARKKHS